MAAALDEADLGRIADAVRRAEAGTAGEIVVVVDRAAGSYRSVTLVIAWLLALLLPWPLLVWTTFSAQTIFASQLVLALLLAVALTVRSDWRLRLVPGVLRRRRAHEVACREFIARGLSRTRARSGVLLYVALAERYAEVMPDVGLAGATDHDRWRGLITELIEAMRDADTVNGLVAAVDTIGDVLRSVAPRGDGDIDELPNSVVMID